MTIDIINRQQRKRRTRFRNPLRKDAGFSLFELTVFIICIAIIYATAVNRFAEFPEQAERANFLAVTTQLQSGVSLELMLAMAEGNLISIADYENSNPMALMLEAPSNYLGEFDFVDNARIQRRSWYFDKRNQELVYLVNNAGNVYLLENNELIATDEIRFRIEIIYREQNLGPAVNSLTQESIASVGAEPEFTTRRKRRSLSGMLLKPVIPYQWDLRNSDLVEDALADP